MRRNIKTNLGRNFAVFGGISKKLIPYVGASFRKNGQSVTITKSPVKTNAYAQNNKIKFKTNLDTGFSKFKFKK